MKKRSFHARLDTSEMMFTCEVCRRKGNVRKLLWFSWETPRHLEEHGIPLAHQYIEGWNEAFQEQYIKNLNKPIDKIVDDSIVVVPKEVIRKSKNKKKKKLRHKKR
jgi:hypothetical protein